MPIRQLKGFKRVTVAKGKTENVTIDIPVKELRYWDENSKAFVTPKGTYEIYVGASSADTKLSGSFVIE